MDPLTVSQGQSCSSLFMGVLGKVWSHIRIMWVKQCHKPSPSHHHFYGWYGYHSQENGWLTWHCFTHIICFQPGFVQQLAAMQEHPQGLGCCNPAATARMGPGANIENHWVQRAQVPSQLLDLQTYQVVYASCYLFFLHFGWPQTFATVAWWNGDQWGLGLCCMSALVCAITVFVNGPLDGNLTI